MARREVDFEGKMEKFRVDGKEWKIYEERRKNF